MKTLLLTSALFTLSLVACGQEKRISPAMTAQGSGVTVAYGAPSMRGRVVFGDLVKYGKVWRTGANEATTVTFSADGMLAGKAVKAGTYSLFTIPGEKEWTIILNSVAQQWGAYKYEEAKDVLRVTVPAQALAQPVEQFTITADGGVLSLRWEKTRVDVPLK